MGKKKVNHILCDTNVLFEFLKGNEKIKKQLDHIGPDRIAFCIITHAEAYCGASKLEFTMLKRFLETGRFITQQKIPQKYSTASFKVITIGTASGFQTP